MFKVSIGLGLRLVLGLVLRLGLDVCKPLCAPSMKYLGRNKEYILINNIIFFFFSLT